MFVPPARLNVIFNVSAFSNLRADFVTASLTGRNTDVYGPPEGTSPGTVEALVYSTRI